MFDFTDHIRRRSTAVETALDQALPPATTPPARLHEAMRYSVFGGGKRLRPLLCLDAAAAAGGPAESALIPAAALEILHTYTLIHDDLPAMDDDQMRRGRATCHIAFDQATAILAGDALLTLAFGLLADAPCAPPHTPADLVRELAAAAGSTGVIGGQMADIAGEGQPLSLDQLRYIHTHKTGDLIRAAARIGGLVAGASPASLAALTAYAEHIGLAFQITDDLLNATGDATALGKAAGTDAARGKMTYVAAFGIDGARREAATQIDAALAALTPLPGPTEPLAALARYILTRDR